MLRQPSQVGQLPSNLPSQKQPTPTATTDFPHEHIDVIRNNNDMRRDLRSHAHAIQDLVGRGPSLLTMPLLVAGSKLHAVTCLLNQGNFGVAQVCRASVAIDTFANVALLQGDNLAGQMTHVQKGLITQQEHPS